VGSVRSPSLLTVVEIVGVVVVLGEDGEGKDLVVVVGAAVTSILQALVSTKLRTSSRVS